METEKPRESSLESILRENEVRTDTKIAAGDDYLRLLEERGLEKQARAFATALKIAEAVRGAGGKALFVGGTVRDGLLKRKSKDFDLEVYGLDGETIERIVNSIAIAQSVGRHFGILKITFGDDVDVDVSAPRVDSKMPEGEGHKDIQVVFDKNMSIKEAMRRRDFTVNSLASDPFTGEVFDGFGGLDDLKNRILRVTDPTKFGDDPLRAVRAMQFIGRLGFTVEPQSMKIIQEMAPRLRALPGERHYKEWRKLLLESEKPSLGLSAARTLGILQEMHPEFMPLKDTPQEYQWHPEGDVWIHTLMAVDEAARIIRREQLEDDDAFVVMLGTMAHDLGKPTTTKFEDGRIRSRAHEEAGVEPTNHFLETINAPGLVREKVRKLVENHLAPGEGYILEKVKGKPVKDGAIRKLAERIAPATIYELVMVGEADHLGRGPFEDPESPNQFLLPLGEYPAGPWLLHRARNLKVEQSRPADLLLGRDLLALGYGPGKHMGDIIRLANRLRDEKEYTREMVLGEIVEIPDPKDAILKLSGMLPEAPIGEG